MAFEAGELRGRWDALTDPFREKWSGLGGRGRAVAGVAAFFALALVAVFAFSLFGSGDDPVAGDDPIALANFVASPEFAALPAEQKRSYMESARKHMKAIEAARREEKIDKKAYRSAYLCSWMERKLEDMHDYHQRPASRRQAWLDKELQGTTTGVSSSVGARQAAAVIPAKSGGGSAAASASVSADGGLLYDDAEGKTKLDEEKDDFEDEFLRTWTPEGRQQWEEFRAAYKKRRDALKAQSSNRSGVPRAK